MERNTMRAPLIGLLLALAPLGLAAPLPQGRLAAREAVAARALPSGTVERNGDSVTLRWQALSGPVTIWRLQRGAARAQDGVIIAQGAEGGEVVLDLPISPRPYFLLRDSKGRELRLAERVLPLEGGMNFRDLGGYRTGDGQMVGWGQLYRSAAMAGLTADDFRYLGGLGIGTVCDFRANEERASAPTGWPADVKPRILTRDYALDMGPLMAAFTSGGITAEKARLAMAEFYKQLPWEHKDQFAEMFGELLAGRAPLAFNCSAGKDRTGMAAVLLLSALGVPRETAVADYLLSNTYYRPKPPAPGAKLDATSAALARLPADVLQVLMSVDPLFIESALDAIEAKGGMDRYLREEMGLSDADRARLKTLYLTR
jgi:protein-tyrosine phosphatase